MSDEASLREQSTPARVADWIAVAGAAAALLSLALLHVVSPEFDPSWRMISEYATGKFGWLLSFMFAAWGISSLALLVGIRRQGRSALFRVGLAFLLAAGLGEVLASVLDVNHPLHDLAGVLGVLGLPVAAILTTTALCRSPAWAAAKGRLRASAHLTWISVLLFAASFAVMALTFHLSGRKMDPQAGPTAHAPAGVIGFVGWTDRLIVVVFCAWVVITACQALRPAGRKASAVQ